MTDDTQVHADDAPEESSEPFEVLTFNSKEEKDEHYNRIYKDREKRLKKTAVSDLLEKLEVEDEDELAEALSDYRVIQEAATTETQALEEKAEKAEKQKQSLKEKLQTTEAERDTASERVETLEKRLGDLITPQFEAVPEHFREAFDEWTIERKADWLAKNADKLESTNGNGRPAGSRPTGPAAKPPKAEAEKEAREAQRLARVSSI